MVHHAVMAPRDLDCLLVHAPKADNHYLPFGEFFNITYMPMGLLAIAEWLRRRGKAVELVHLGVEWLEDPKFRVAQAYDGAKIRAIGLSLYWHYQSYDAIEVARALKAAHPEAFVFLGGLTAGYFAAEIVRDYDFIDGVLVGHAEATTEHLVDALDGGDLGEVAHLVWRTPDGRVRQNDLESRKFRTGGPALDELVYGDLSVMRNPGTYSSSFGFPLAYARELTPAENRQMQTMGRAFFPLFIGRGCAWTCTFCGGNRDTLRKVNGTSKLAWRDPERIVSDIRRAMDFGYKTMALCFDPTPQKDDYYCTLFQRIREEQLGCDFYFECWGLPTERFVREFKRTFPSPESYLAISPDAGDDAVRLRNKQPYYTNVELFETLHLLESTEVTFDVFYTIALPGENVHTARASQAQINEIAAKFRRARRLMTWSVQLEPGSPQFERPESFDMITDRRNFKDFHAAHGGDRADTYSSLGFKIRNFFGDARDEGGIAEFEKHLQHLKCMEFCFLGRDPRFWATPAAGRQHCHERRTMLAERAGVTQPLKPIAADWTYGDAVAEERALRPRRERHGWV